MLFKHQPHKNAMQELSPLSPRPFHSHLLLLNTHLSSEALVEPSGDHATGIGLDGEDSPEAVSESPADQVAPAAGLKLDDAPAGHVVLLVELAGSVEGLQSQEADPHLQERAG